MPCRPLSVNFGQSLLIFPIGGIDPKEKRMTLMLFVMCVALFILLVRKEKRLIGRIEKMQAALDRMQTEWDRGRRPE